MTLFVERRVAPSDLRRATYQRCGRDERDEVRRSETAECDPCCRIAASTWGSTPPSLIPEVRIA